MVQIMVDRLILHAPGYSAGDGERIARAVADRLRQRPQPAGRVDALEVRLTAAPNERSDHLAERVVVAVEHQLGRELR